MKGEGGKIWAAVDVMGGECVQLKGGDPDTARFNRDARAAARHWAAQGADGLHLIDLDAALERGHNRALLEAIARETDAPVQIGGGVRDDDALRFWLDTSADRVIVGTRGVADPDWLADAAQRHPDRIVLAVDARGDEVVISGWTRGAGVKLLDLAARVAGLPLAGLLYTNVGVEGSLHGIDPEPVRALCGAADLPVLVSGGLKDARDVAAAFELGAAGVVLGTALYAGAISLSELGTERSTT